MKCDFYYNMLQMILQMDFNSVMREHSSTDGACDGNVARLYV